MTISTGVSVKDDVSVYRAIHTPELYQELFKDVPQRLKSDPIVNRLLEKARRKLQKLEEKERAMARRLEETRRRNRRSRNRIREDFFIY